MLCHVESAENSVSGPVGNVFDKYHSRNPLVRSLMRKFLRSVNDLTVSAAPKNVLEVGCGEGYLSDHLLRSVPTIQSLEACDLSLDRVPLDLKSRINFRIGSAYELPYESRSFDLVVCCEVLEHLSEPQRALAELCRVTRRFVLLSTPREPLWRILNAARGRYWSAWGNTPGHIQHFSSRELVALARQRLQSLQVRRPIPWTVVMGSTGTNQWS